MQNCTILHYFVVHAAHGVKAYQVNFPTQLTAHLLDFPRWSYWQNTEDCAEYQQPRGNNSEPISWRPFHIVYLIFFFSCLHLSRRDVPSINTSLPLSNRTLLINEIQNPFVQLCANKPLRVDLYPFALVISFAGLQQRRLHPLPIGAPTPFEVSRLIVGCVGWFLESVVGRILDSGCRLKTVVGFEFYCQVALVIVACSKLSWLLWS